MTKRSLDDRTSSVSAQKRVKTSDFDRLSYLSDELVLRILSFLEVSDLVICYRLSHRLQILSRDSQLWRLLYYRKFIKPRSSRMLKLSRWLQEHQSLTDGRQIDWKKRYKLSHNWSKGKCNVRKTRLPMVTSVPSLLVRMHKDLIVTAQRRRGLQVWSAAAEQVLLLSRPWEENIYGNHNGPIFDSTPTALAVDSLEGRPDSLQIAVGFAGSIFVIYQYNTKSRTVDSVHIHSVPRKSAVTMIAMAARHVVLSYGGDMELYHLDPLIQHQQSTRAQSLPRPLASLSSYTPGRPMALSIRVINARICVSVAFVLPSYYFGWVVGVQETIWRSDGTLLSCRNASSHQAGSDRDPTRPLLKDPRPTSLSYTHPYLLTAHADNTLTLFLVSSDNDELRIGEGQKLWGHASSVAGALINGRGKAISVTNKGGELRVWDLEGGGESMAMKKRLLAGDLSIRIAADTSLGSEPKTVSRGRVYSPSIQHTIRSGEWVDFDEEKVVVLHERVEDNRDLVVYDFT